jgi:hypothetical protein
MLQSLASVALLGASAVFAAPPGGYPHGGSGSYPHGSSGDSSSGGQVPFKFPLDNGFPNIKVPSAALTKIEKQAHGTLPNAPLSKTLQPGDETIFELIAFNEFFEVAFFTSLLTNITTNVKGFEIPSPAIKNIVVNALIAVQAQEELHNLGANGILAAAGQTTVQPCEYVFPSSTFDEAIDFARTFTDLVLGTLQDAQAGLAKNGDQEYIPLVGSVIGQEGEQNGFYRNQLGIDTGVDLIPSELPFLTRSAGPFAFSALNQNVVVNGTCGNIGIIKLPVFGVLALDTPTPIQGKDQELEFSFSKSGLKGVSLDEVAVVFINSQNLPVVEKPKIISQKGDTVKVQAFLPFNKFISKSSSHDVDLLSPSNLSPVNGLTIAAVTNSSGPFEDVPSVAAATLFGPALIEIN